MYSVSVTVLKAYSHINFINPINTYVPPHEDVSAFSPHFIRLFTSVMNVKFTNGFTLDGT